MNYNGKPLLQHVYEECLKTKLDIVIAIPHGDYELIEFCEKNEIPYFAGPENDVITRFYDTARHHDFNPIIRVCADSKEINHKLILQQLKNYTKYDYPICYGNFCEVFGFDLLKYYCYTDKRPETREHVTYGMITDMTVNYWMDINV